MEPKEFDIEFPRGDTCALEFTLVDAKKTPIVLGEGDELYFTVKKNFNTNEAIFQKKYTSNQIVQSDGKYTLTLETEDTNRLSYGSYVYDICLKSGSYRKTLCLGNIILTNESTFVGNE